MPDDPNYQQWSDKRQRRRHRPSFTGALIVIGVGIFLLVVNLYPALDAWTIIGRYWPVILILIGLGKVVEAFRYSGAPGDPNPPRQSAMPFVVLAAVALLIVAMVKEGHVEANLHDSHALELGGAKDVDAKLEMATGKFSMTGGADRLLNADFKYLASDGKPVVDYSVNNGRGNIDISQPNDSHIRMMNSHNQWDLRFSDQVPLDLDFTLGAGEARLDTRGMDLRNLFLNIGTGALNLDLTGPRTHNMNVTLKGGIGSATLELPKDVGVTAHASGGIGAVLTHGLTQNDHNYVNSAFGKTPATINITIEGGIGKIELNAD
jgi:N-terminal domain of toast_rack, DUF2154/Domain of unknown function (DUF5668)